MAAADPRDAPVTDPNPGVTASGPRESAPSVTPSSDTLLSAPTPATREDLLFDERLSESERRIAELLLRVESLERTVARSSAPQARRALWFWCVFLAGLALAWQILSHFR